MIARSEALKQLRLLKADIINGLSFVSKTKDKNLSLESLDMAIKSLETDEAYQLEYEQPEISKGLFEQIKWERDIAIQQLHELGYEFGQKIETTTKNDLRVDCISRADAIGSIAVECSAEKLDIDYAKFLMLRRAIKALPSVTPIRPKGHWICDGKGRSFADYHCSECGLKLALCGQDIKQRQDSGYSLFCGGCGADMREVEE